ncbi:8-amino-7-oxononanoate synthase [Candidatus Palibaumannia cicadellinicola]|uniref:8-amino-7-oxononanoate synthase n=1 Tax=Baumannia cicadellinicola subsp. Homalodisca coagulata TaxID=374463 RepID=Q1LTL7_BAUCH|nr:8-amino-7-oxononanoate synthase [Candidatus Baumannia cicadellinicola]ABF14195.1 8-amino-7-oxononanoate synthase [Baumannia cicadellinicola str. Hc (Homalodisca coagulata)]MCJ7462320.1 8-amino-7-oxononanoate synthase [Candidatus Baumannia cicadellinicola]MCJ7462840.1 8-amino-7-oxononanoate synthase [Candidatus Baumannia cicadellinicola]
MTSLWIQRCEKALAIQKQKKAYRYRKLISGGNDRILTYQGKRYLNFSSNDYLGLARHPEVIAAYQQVAIDEGISSGGSGHVIGYSPRHQRLENQLANWLSFPRALLFCSGYIANQAVISALTTVGDYIFADRLSHSSLLNAAIQSSAELIRFRHNDISSLQHLLQRFCQSNCLVITEGVFSMDGDQAPLSTMIPYIRAVDSSWLMVDDAHGFGILGLDGCGCCWDLNQDFRPEILIVNFSKAVGVSGAAVLCQEQVAEYLIQFSSHLIYSTALPPAIVAATEVALTLIRTITGKALRQQLQDNINHFRYGIQALGLGYRLLPSITAIQPLLIGDNLSTLNLVSQLREQGLWLTAIRPPTVPPNSARIRITLTAAHNYNDIEQLLEALANVNK